MRRATSLLALATLLETAPAWAQLDEGRIDPSLYFYPADFHCRDVQAYRDRTGIPYLRR